MTASPKKPEDPSDASTASLDGIPSAPAATATAPPAAAPPSPHAPAPASAPAPAPAGSAPGKERRDGKGTPAASASTASASASPSPSPSPKGGSYAPEPDAQKGRSAPPDKAEGVADEAPGPSEDASDEAPAGPDASAWTFDGASGTPTVTEGVADPSEGVPSFPTGATVTAPPAPSAQPAQQAPPAPSPQAPAGSPGPVPPQPTDDEVREEVRRQERKALWQATRNAVGTALAVAPGIAGQGVATAMGTVTRLMDAFFSGGPMAVGSRVFAEALADADTLGRLGREAASAYGIAQDADREALKGTYQGRMLEARDRASREGIARAHLWMARQPSLDSMDHAALDRLGDAMDARRRELAQQARDAPRGRRRAIAAEISALDDVAKGMRSRRSALRTDEREQRDRASREEADRWDAAYDALPTDDIRRIAMDAYGRRDVGWTGTPDGPVPTDPAQGRRIASALQDRAAALREQGDPQGSERLAREAERIALASETPAARAQREGREERASQREADRLAREQARAQKEQDRLAAEQAESDRLGALSDWQRAWETESRRVGRGVPEWDADGLPARDLGAYARYAQERANALPDGDERDAWLARVDAADLGRIVRTLGRNGDTSRSGVNADRAAQLIDRRLADEGITQEMLSLEDGGASLSQALPGLSRDARALVANRLARDAARTVAGLGTDPAVKRWLKEAAAAGTPEGYAGLGRRVAAYREARDPRTGRRIATHARSLERVLDSVAQAKGTPLPPETARRLAGVLSALRGFDPAEYAERAEPGDARRMIDEAGDLVQKASEGIGMYREGFEKRDLPKAVAGYTTLRRLAAPDPMTHRSPLDAVEASLGLSRPVAASASPDRATAMRIAGRVVLASRLGVSVPAGIVKSAEALLKGSRTSVS